MGVENYGKQKHNHNIDSDNCNSCCCNRIYGIKADACQGTDKNQSHKQ